MKSSIRSVSIGASLAMCLLSGPAGAYKWPGDIASIGGAVSAKVIGRACKGVLDAGDIAQLDAFLAKAAREWAADPAKKNGPPLQEFVDRLTADYESTYRDAKACNASATEEARDMLQRVRTAMASGKPLFADKNDPDRHPDALEVIQAKVVAEKCAELLTARQWADFEFYLARYWVKVAKSSTDGDARATFELYKSAERNFAAEWQPKACTDTAARDAKALAVLVGKALGSGSR